MASASARGTQEQPLALRALLACGVIGPLSFIAVFLCEGAVRPDYSAWRHFVSGLSLGDRGWVQTANFVVSGALVLGFAIGLRRMVRPSRGSTWAPVLLGAFALGLIGSGLFPMDPLLGYPPGAPATRTLVGSLHHLMGFVVFASLPAAAFVLAPRFARDQAWRGWAAYSVAAGVMVIVFLIAGNVAANLGPGAPAGLLQRLSIITGWTWIALLAFRLMLARPPIG